MRSAGAPTGAGKGRRRWYSPASACATGTSASGGSVSDTRMVSPMPSSSRAPMPVAPLARPSSPSPASVTPRWSGYSSPWAFRRAHSSR